MSSANQSYHVPSYKLICERFFLWDGEFGDWELAKKKKKKETRVTCTCDLESLLLLLFIIDENFRFI